MRITKVKIKNNGSDSLVLMKRDIKKGYLKHGNYSYADTDEIQKLIEQKKDEFQMSFLNKTIQKEDYLKKYKNKRDNNQDYKNKWNNLKTIKNIFECIIADKKPNKYIDFKCIRKLSRENLSEYLNYRFSESEDGIFNYKYDKQNYSFNLIDGLHDALRKFDSFDEILKAQDLLDYKNWVSRSIETKQHYLAKSIFHNKLYVKDGKNISIRKKVLKKWALDMIQGTGIDIDCLANHFKLEELSNQWLDIINHSEKYTKNDVEEIKGKKLKLGDNVKVGEIKDYFELKKQLKKALQTHQKNFVTPENLFLAHPDLNQYNLEVTKYLMLYFPLKKSGKKLSQQYCEYYLKPENIKNYIQKRIINIVIQHLLQEGKRLSYQGDNKAIEQGNNNDLCNIESEDLEEIKVKEAFALKFINACAFAANNLRNCIDSEQKNDILEKKTLLASLNKIFYSEVKTDSIFDQAVTKAVSFFLLPQKTESFVNTTNHNELFNYLYGNRQNFVDFITSLRGSIRDIRNKVVHYKKDALNEIFNIHDQKFECFGFKCKEKTKEESLIALENEITKESIQAGYNNSYLQKLLEKELSQLPFLFAEQFKTAGLFDYYPIDRLIKHLSDIHLVSKPLAFVPGFKKIFSWGIKYQEDQQAGLNLIHFKRNPPFSIQKEVISIEAAQYNVMKLAYEQLFITKFLEDERKFSEVVNCVIQANRDRASTSKNRHCWAFHEVLSYDMWKKGNVEATPQQYLQYVQSESILEENKKREEGTISDDETGNFQQFIWQVFIKGFNEFLNQHEWITSPENQLGNESSLYTNQRHEKTNEFVVKLGCISSNIDTDNSTHIAFWGLCKLLDARHLNELSNQISKWLQAESKGVTSLTLSSICIMQEIIQLSLINADKVHIGLPFSNNNQILVTSENSDAHLETHFYFRNETKDILSKSNIFVQSDEETPILFKHIELVRKYATADIFKKIIGENETFKTSLTDITDWQTKQKGISGIALARQKLHLRWAKKPTRKEKKEWVIKHGEVYQQFCIELDQYNWLDNKVHLVHIKNLHHLLIQILGRLAGFVALFDRDFQFFDKGASAYTKDNLYHLAGFMNLRDLVHDLKNNKDNDNIEKIIDCRTSLPVNLDNLSKKEKDKLIHQLEEKRKQFASHFYESANNFKPFEKRNYIAHFNYLTKSASGNSILDLLSHTRSLVSYDRKLKNAVAKSFIQLLDRHGIEIKFKPLHDNNHEFIIEDEKKGGIKPKKIKHLGGEKFKQGEKRVSIETDQVHLEYVRMVRALLEFKQ